MTPLRLRRVDLVAAALAVSLIPCGSRAQTASAPPQPSEPHEALSFFEGSWTTSEAKPEENFRETCSWLPTERRHMVCRSQWLTANGPREGLSIFSVDSSSGDYLYNGFRPSGIVVTHRGQRTPKGWIFGSERSLGAERVRTRITIESTPEGGFNFLSETATGDGPWKAAARIVYQRRGN
jgi:hypothetical protein